ncbi:MAG: dihydrolipoamide acetyltransferase family protein [Hydrogenophaga sp.]|uniref:dihydrolipoamide acetyltransferase family protein n=1 Tax=Hydrogenophaga sp. TaxID=1904254 RepID=UPI002ABC00B4|nr:dihydrolipoamide acetyltransferase family protein [Hydrogenophaga sp.]MDZ4283912.1 dihydrolipoamide acetyltransferase family protein [Hydrogenophaga sp.]
MRRELLVPKLGLTMAEGTLVEWMVKPGDAFRADQSIFVIESEKAATEIPAEADGTLLEITAELGATLAVGAVIGFWDDLAAGASEALPELATAAVAPLAALVVPQAATSTLPALRAPGERLLATPLARRLALARCIDLSSVEGSGPRGRIRAGDLPANGHKPAAVSPSTSVAPPVASGPLRAPTATEQTIARRLVTAKQEIPHFYLSVEAEVSALQALRSELNAAQADVRFTLNHFILAAVGRALAQMPGVNRVWTTDGILSLPKADVGMAVHTERGLMVPVLRDVGRLSLAQLAREAASAASRAQAGRLGVTEMAGGAITVSNAGMHDVTYMTSIINPGQAMILGIGSVRSVFRPNDQDQPALRREMGMVLSADHRVLDGVTALQLLKCIVAALERPLGLLVA